MGLLTRSKALVLVGCALFASQSYAANIQWSDGYDGMFGDPQQACKSSAEKNFASNPIFEVDHVGPVTTWANGYGGYAGSCQAFVKQRDGGGIVVQSGNGYVGRSGTTCADGQPFNPDTGICPAPAQTYQPGEKCDDQTGGTPSNPMIYDDTVSKCVKFTESEGDAPCSFLKATGEANPGYAGTAYTVAGVIGAGGQATAPPTFAQDGLKCVMATVSSSDCKVAGDGTATCNVIGKFTGKGSSTGTSDVSDALCPNGTCDPQEPEVKTTETPCVPSGTGGGGSGCTATKETKEDGSQQCGTVNGAYKCFTKPPYSNGIKTDISSTSQTLPDGSVKVTTVKDSTNTVCTDINACTTKTSTTTTTSTTKPNGTTTTDTSCKGACSPNGGGLEGNPGAGSGNPATGDGDGGNGDGEGGGGTADISNECSAPPPCDGDVFLCAILKQNHIDTCKLMAEPTAAEKAQAKAKTDAAYASLDAHQADLDGKANGLLQQFQSSVAGGSSTGKCLPDKQLPLGPFGQLNLEFSKTCDSMAWVRLVLLAGAYLFAARVVFREV